MSLSVVESQVSIDLINRSLDVVAAPVYVKGQDHRWLFANAACCKLLDMPLEKLQGCSDHEILALVDADVLRSQDESFFKTQTWSNQPITLDTHAGQCQFLGDRSLLQTNNGLVLVNTLQDVSELMQMCQINDGLQQQLDECHGALDQLTEFEATLKRITDRVRDSLDEKQILQTAVQELTEALNVRESNTSLYDLEQGTSTIYYEYTTLPSDRGRVSQLEAFAEVYYQLLEGQYLQFCSIAPNPVRGLVSMLACPIFG